MCSVINDNGMLYILCMCCKVGESESDLDSEGEEDSGSSNHLSGKHGKSLDEFNRIPEEFGKLFLEGLNGVKRVA